MTTRKTINDNLRTAEKHLDSAFSILNVTAYNDDSILTDQQIIFVQRAMDQISNASDNIIKAMN